MKKIWNGSTLLCTLLCIYQPLLPSEVANFQFPAQNNNVVIFLSTTKSGSNVITGCLSAITRKPISWFEWGDSILDPLSPHRQHISYNRLSLELSSETPLLYRTHYRFNDLMQVPSEKNKLIFATRNPKELLYRKFFSHSSLPRDNPDIRFIDNFLRKYLKAFQVFDAWSPNNRAIVFYEDFINNDEEQLLRLLQFMEEPPLFIEDFLTHKQEYLSRLLQSYAVQHTNNYGGSSSQGSPKAIYYTKNACPKTLQSIDSYLKLHAPLVWESYLKRFEEPNTP